MLLSEDKTNPENNLYGYRENNLAILFTHDDLVNLAHRRPKISYGTILYRVLLHYLSKNEQVYVFSWSKT